jgi:hypothetical protein
MNYDELLASAIEGYVPPLPAAPDPLRIVGMRHQTSKAALDALTPRERDRFYGQFVLTVMDEDCDPDERIYKIVLSESFAKIMDPKYGRWLTRHYRDKVLTLIDEEVIDSDTLWWEVYRHPEEE